MDALADGTRRRIVELLAERDRTAGELADAFQISRSGVSRHLRVLREAGLIEVARKRGTWVFYRLVPEAVEQLAFALGGAPRPEGVLATAERTVAW